MCQCYFIIQLPGFVYSFGVGGCSHTMDQRPVSHHPARHGAPQKHPPMGPHPSKRNYKLLIDPNLVNGANKLYR